MQTEMMTGETRSVTEEETDTSQVVLAASWPTTVPRLLKWARLWRKRMARETWTPWPMMLTSKEARATNQPQPPSG